MSLAMYATDTHVSVTILWSGSFYVCVCVCVQLLSVFQGEGDEDKTHSPGRETGVDAQTQVMPIFFKPLWRCLLRAQMSVIQHKHHDALPLTPLNVSPSRAYSFLSRRA